jgi:hypothetical protein
MRAVPAAVPLANHHVFPVRFNPTSGLSALLRRPQNSYRWIGVGSLLVDEHGVRVTARRLTLFGVFRTVLFVLPTEIREVYREGDSIRIDLQTGTRHDFFRFWAESANAAAEIVRQLPTSRTIELEGGPAWAHAATSSEAYRSALWLALGVAIVGALAWVGVDRLLSGHEPTSFAPFAAPANKVPDLLPPVATDVVPSGSDSATLQARADLLKFTRRLDVLSVQFRTAFEALQRGQLTQENFVDGIEKWLLPQCEALGAELPLLTNPPPVRASADAEIRATIDNWHRGLMAYAQGLRAHDSTDVFNAFNYLRAAETHQQKARALLDKLDAQQ